VHRDISPRYLSRFDVTAIAAPYHAILTPGESAPLGHLQQAVHTDPWLLLDSHELLSRSAARAALGMADDESPIVAVLRSGRPPEERAADRVAQELESQLPRRARTVVLMPLNAQLDEFGSNRLVVWPLLKLLPGIDVLVGAGGYNTVQEARATATPLVAFAHPRLYDRQHRRLTPDERVLDRDQACARIHDHLCRQASRTARPQYRNGVHEAIAVIERHLMARARPGHTRTAAPGGPTRETQFDPLPR